MIWIDNPVGYRAKNDAGDVAKIHDILNRIPSAKGGAPIYIPPGTPYSPELTDIHILSFQNKWFSGNSCDAVVSPHGATLRKMNELALESPQNRDNGKPLNVLAIMSDLTEGRATLKGFSRETVIDPSDGKKKHRTPGQFTVPLYILKIGRDAGDGKTIVEGTENWYHVIRFGVCFHNDAVEAGKHSSQWFSIEGPPVGEYVLKRNSYAHGSWLLRGDFLIHAGPTIGGNTLYGGLGCIQPVNGGMKRLDDCVRKLSFGELFTKGTIKAEAADKKITDAGSFRCIVEKANLPPVICADNSLAAAGGPREGTRLTRLGTGF